MATTGADLAAALQAVFTAEADGAAAAAGFVRRRRLFPGAAFVQALAFGWLANPGASLDELADLAADLGCPASRQALGQRFTPQAVDCLSRALRAALLRLVEACPVAAPLPRRFAGVYARDCPTITLPGARAEAGPGCGHARPERPAAGAKRHAGLELSRGARESLSPHAARTSGRCAAGSHAPLPERALLLEDLGFFDLQRLRHYDGQGCSGLSRAPARLSVRVAGGREQALPAPPAGCGRDRLDCWVTAGRRQKRGRCRRIAVRVPDDVARRRLGRAGREAKDLGRPPRAARRALCAWAAPLTNAPAAPLGADEVLALRRVRWQVELRSRLWKGEGKVDETRSRKPCRVLCALLAKLLGQVAQHGAALLAGSPLEVSGVKAARRVRRRAARRAESLTAPEALVAVRGRLQERPRRVARERGRPGRPTTPEVLQAPAEQGGPVPPERGNEGTGPENNPALHGRRAEAA